jgi:ArsR family transcriptional regulator
LLHEPLTAAQAGDLARTLKALADPTRLRLVSMVAAHDGGEACVCDLTEPLGLTQPTVSHHLKILVDAGIFTRDKRGVWACYALRPGALQALADILATSGQPPHSEDG